MAIATPIGRNAGETRLRRFVEADAGSFGDCMTVRENTRYMTFPDEVKTREAAPSKRLLSALSFVDAGEMVVNGKNGRRYVPSG